MTLSLEPIVLPLTTDTQGVVRVKNTRVPIDFIIYDYLAGDSAEDIAKNYPTLSLSDVHAVLSYYLAHKSEVNAYIAEQEVSAETKYKYIKNRSSQEGLRQQLLERLDTER
jgi:uncharacterized protein (DUF433 family)